MRKSHKGPAPRDLGERFWSKVDRRGPDECWEWQAFRSKKGYGKMLLGSRADSTNRKEYAHRIAWMLEHGSMPKACVLHRCDNPPCCNPAHLRDGTQQENSRDMVERGRGVSRPPRGESNPRAKLTEEAVNEILMTGAKAADLARKFGVSKSLVVAVRKRRAWKHAECARSAAVQPSSLKEQEP